MNQNRFQEAKCIYGSALEIEPGKREAFLKEACAGNESLRKEVESLLACQPKAKESFKSPAVEVGEKHGALLSRPAWQGELEHDPEEPLGASPSGEATLTGGDNMEAAAAPAPGLQLGPYKIEAVLGAGGMGQVLRARDTRLGRPVAIKLVRTEAAANRFFREARSASALNHPNIITIYDIGASGTSRYIAMELVQGATLRWLAAELSADFSFEQLRQIGAQAARALSAAHAAGIVHRDIKPENIMVRQDGLVKVLDFGLARIDPAAFAEGDASAAELRADNLTAPGTLLGTLRYMSPEQSRAEVVTAASDVFSLGVVLYELAAGQHPFAAETPRDALLAIQSAAPLAPSTLRRGIPAVFDALVLRMLEKDPRLRPAAAEVEAALSESAMRMVVAPAAKPRRTVGRENELQQLETVYQSVLSGRGLIACVTGEPGIGKTTLVGNFLGKLAGRGDVCSIASGRCSERLAGTEAYLPILECLESLLRGPAGEAASRILQLIAPAWYLLVASASSAERTPELADAQMASQERLKREFVAFLQEICRLRPLIIFLDDLHWSDVSTVDLLAYVGSKLDSMRLLLVATYRPADLKAFQHPFLPLKLELQGRNLCREIMVEFLSQEDVRMYLDLEFAGHRFPPELLALIHARTEGNALFMVDLVHYLKEHNVISQENGDWVMAKPVAEVEGELPESVRSVIQTKIGRFREDDRRLLTAASVQGAEFDSRVVAKVLGRDQEEVEDRLEALDRDHRFVRISGEREFPDSGLALRYAFVHVLYQNTLYHSLTVTRKARLSGAVAQALQDAYGEQSREIASELALLYEAARNFRRAADCFLEAARNANRVYATEQADALAQRAIANAERLQGPPRYSRVVAAAMLRSLIHRPKGMIPELLADFDLAEEAARLAGEPQTEINVIIARGNTLGLIKRLEDGEREILRGLERAKGIGWKFGIAAAEAGLAGIWMVQGKLDKSVEYYDRSLPVLEKGGPAFVVMLSCTSRAWLHEYQLEYEGTERTLNLVKKREQEEGAIYFRFMSAYIGGLALGNRGRISEAVASLEWIRRVAELNDERIWLPRLPNALGWIRREMQDIEGALRLDAEGVRLGRELGCWEGEANSHVNLGHDYVVLGELPRALEHLEEAERIYNQDVWNRWRYYIRLQAERASYWIARGDLKQAARYADICLEKAKVTLSRKHWAWAHKLRGDIAMLEERAPDAWFEYQTATSILDGFPCPIIAWRILWAASNAARALHDAASADDLRRRARHTAQTLADSVKEAPLREHFLGSQVIREI